MPNIGQERKSIKRKSCERKKAHHAIVNKHLERKEETKQMPTVYSTGMQCAPCLARFGSVFCLLFFASKFLHLKEMNEANE